MKEKINYMNFFFEAGDQGVRHKLDFQIADHLPALVFVYHAGEKRLSYVNREFGERFGFSQLADPDSFGRPVSVMGKEWTKALHAADSLSAGEQTELHVRMGNGEIYDIRARLLSRDTDGTPGQVLFVGQLRSTMVNKESIAIKEIYSETEELLHFGSWAWEPDQEKVEWSAGVYSILGYHIGEVKPSIKLFVDHILPEYRQEVVRLLEDGVRHQTGFEIEFEVKTKNEQIRIIQSKGKCVSKDPGGSPRLVGIMRDITSVRNAEREQERTLKELNRSNRELEEFAYVASHDLQEPLRKIAMFSERLRVRYGNAIEKDGQLFMDRILSSADNMKVLIDNLLEFSKANRSSQNFAPIELQDVIDEVLSDLDLKIEETGTRVLITSPLPKIEGVYSEMKQLFSNLISNAIKFRKQDVQPVITINAHKATKVEKLHYSLNQSGTYYVIDLKDNGIGFEQEYAEKIFQIFHRLHGKSEYPGSGIGLAICKKIIDNHNGTISALSAALQGATFTLVLPQKQL
jgi:PAS domain S-box-containing protein